jgi:hypothetical protein
VVSPVLALVMMGRARVRRRRGVVIAVLALAVVLALVVVLAIVVLAIVVLAIVVGLAIVVLALAVVIALVVVLAIVVLAIVVVLALVMVVPLVVIAVVPFLVVLAAAIRELHHAMKRVVHSGEPLFDARTARAALGDEPIGSRDELARRVAPAVRFDASGSRRAPNGGGATVQRARVLARHPGPHASRLGVEHRRDLFVQGVDLGDARPLAVIGMRGRRRPRTSAARRETEHDRHQEHPGNRHGRHPTPSRDPAPISRG